MSCCCNSSSSTIYQGLAWNLKLSLQLPGPCFNIKTTFLGMGIPVKTIWWSCYCLTHKMGMPVLGRQHICYEIPLGLFNYLHTCRKTNSITVMSHECNCISNQQKLACFFKSLFRLDAMKTSKLCITAIMRKLLPWHDMITFHALTHTYTWIAIFIFLLTHWGRVTHICVGNLYIIGWDNGLSPGRRQAITWTNVGILLIGPLGTNFSEMLIKIHTFSFKKIHLKMSSGKWRPFCLGLNVLMIDIHPLLVKLYAWRLESRSILPQVKTCCPTALTEPMLTCH